MDQLLIIFQIILFSVVGTYLYRLYSKTLPEPDGSDLLFKTRGGGSVNFNSNGLYLHLTWPFVTIHLFKDIIELNYGGRKVTLLYSDVTEVSRYYSGIRIHHKDSKQPTFVTFGSRKSEEIMRRIIDHMSKSVS